MLSEEMESDLSMPPQDTVVETMSEQRSSLDDNLVQTDQTLIHIPIIGQKAFLFNIEHIKYLRENYGITGILSGILPVAPQQNQLLGLPLRLSTEEVLYLADLGIAYLADSSSNAVDFWVKDIKSDEKEFLSTKFMGSLKDQVIAKRHEYELKMQMMNLPVKKESDNALDISNKVVTLQTPDSSTLHDIRPEKFFASNTRDLQKKLLLEYLGANTKEGSKGQSLLDYKVYKYLKSKPNDFYILPGLRFGGKFIAYPGDPLRYHAHLIVNPRDYYEDDIGVPEIVNGGRLATSVKKLWCVCGSKSSQESITLDAAVDHILDSDQDDIDDTDNEMIFFSVEWAGFG